MIDQKAKNVFPKSLQEMQMPLSVAEILSYKLILTTFSFSGNQHRHKNHDHNKGHLHLHAVNL